MNPRTPTGQPPQGRIKNSNNVDWSSFKEYLQKTYRPITARGRFQYALRYNDLLLNEDFSKLNLVSDHTRLHILKALCILSKFLGRYDKFNATMQKYGLKWSIGNKDDLIITRMLKPLNSKSVVDWIKKANERVPEANPYIDLMLFTGLRPLEGIDVFNLIIKLENKGELHEYYDSDKQMLAHFRFKKVFIRKSKKVFISFAPKDILTPIFDCKTLIRRAFYKLFERKRLPIRFCDIREYWATQMTRHLSRVEIDFLQGRVSGNVFMTNYFNPAYIEDLQTRTINAARQLLHNKA